MTRPLRVVIAGGGTGGHAFPALALAKALAQPGPLGGDDAAEVRLVGTVTGPEGAAATAAGIRFDGLDVTGFRRSLAPADTLANLKAAAKSAGATLQAWRILRRSRADVAVGTGAYASLPVVFAAALRRTPLVLHEQNAVPGRANRLAGRWATAVAVSFPESARWFTAPVRVTGNPVRPEIAHVDAAALRPVALREFGLQAGRHTLLVFGGSQGARRINQATLGVYDRWRNREDLQVLHLVGSKEYPAMQERLAGLQDKGDAVVWRLVGFTDRMDLAYAAADLALCRAGAATLFEVAAAAVPAIVVPYPFAGGHQAHNTEVLVKNEAIVLLQDEACTPQKVGDLVDELLVHDERRATMSRHLEGFARPDAAADLADLVRDVGRRR